MKLVWTNGCIVSNLDIDDVSFGNLSEEEKEVVWSKLFESIEHTDENLQNLLQWYLETYGTHKHLYCCEQCGDEVCEITARI